MTDVASRFETRRHHLEIAYLIDDLVVCSPASAALGMAVTPRLGKSSATARFIQNHACWLAGSLGALVIAKLGQAHSKPKVFPVASVLWPPTCLVWMPSRHREKLFDCNTTLFYWLPCLGTPEKGAAWVAARDVDLERGHSCAS